MRKQFTVRIAIIISPSNLRLGSKNMHKKNKIIINNQTAWFLIMRATKPSPSSFSSPVTTNCASMFTRAMSLIEISAERQLCWDRSKSSKLKGCCSSSRMGNSPQLEVCFSFKSCCFCRNSAHALWAEFHFSGETTAFSSSKIAVFAWGSPIPTFIE